MNAAEFEKKGFLLVASFLPADDCAELLNAVASYRAVHPVSLIDRPSGDRPLRYSVIDGLRVREHFPELVTLAAKIGELVNSFAREPLSPLADERVAININITPQGGAYRWHYDRNAVTAILYLNAVDGGETEMYPNHRLAMPGGHASRLQKLADAAARTTVIRRTFGRRVLFKPEAGTLLVMRGDRCLHSVQPVRGGADRVNVVFSYDLPGRTFAVADDLNRYLYESEPAPASDPNYIQRP